MSEKKRELSLNSGLRKGLKTILLMVVSIAILATVAFAAKDKATLMKLVKTEGTVQVFDKDKEELDIDKDMRLFSGYHEITGKESYAWISLDDSKAIKLNENTETEIRKKWRKLKILLVHGDMSFNVSVPLEIDEAMNIHSSTMVTGIRGTFGWISVVDGGKTRVYLIEGELKCLVSNPVDGSLEEVVLKPGEWAEFVVRDPQGGNAVTTEIIPGKFTREDIPAFVLAEIVGNQDLISKIKEQTGVDFSDLTEADVQKKLEEEQKRTAAKVDEINGKAAEQNSIISKDPVWTDTSNALDSIVYLTMPQKAKTVQKYLNGEKIWKVVLLKGKGSDEDNTLKVDIPFTVPANKMLEARTGVDVTVEENFSFTVDGTADLFNNMTNRGTVSVNSPNSLRIGGLLYNYNKLINGINGHIVLGSGLISEGTISTEGLIESSESGSGESMITILSGSFEMKGGEIISDSFNTILNIRDAKEEVTLKLDSGSICNEKQNGAALTVGDSGISMQSFGTDIMSVSDTLLGTGVDMEKYGVGSVWRTDGRYHLVLLTSVEHYNVNIKVEGKGSISAPSPVEAGATVPITVTAADGYQLESLTVDNVEMGASRSFKMPQHAVEIRGLFKEIEKQEQESAPSTEPVPETVPQQQAISPETPVAPVNAPEPVKAYEPGVADHLYEISIKEVSGGIVKANVTKAKKGDTVILTVTSGKGYRLYDLKCEIQNEGEQNWLYGGPIAAPAENIHTETKNFAFQMPGSDVSIEASFNKIKCNVYFVDDNGNSLREETVYDYGTAAADIVKPADPAKAADVKYTYTFAGWTPEITAVEEDAVYVATYTATLRQYNVTFVDEDGTTVLQEAAAYDYGTAAAGIVKPADPTKPADAEYTYTFAGWTPEIADVIGNVTYQAVYNAELVENPVTTVTGIELDQTQADLKLDETMTLTATVLPASADNKVVEWFCSDETIATATTGVTTSQVTVTPLKAGTVTITAKTQDGGFTASCEVNVAGYTVIWKDGDEAGTILAKDTVNFGITPVYSGDAPTKAATAEYSYTFAGWKVGTTEYALGTDLPAVTGDVTYTAYYKESKNQYNVTFVDEDGTTVLQEATAYDYGTAAADIVKPADPTKAADAQYTYTFAGWTPEITAVEGNATYKATYTATIRQYNVTFVDENGTTVLQEATAYDYGTAAADIIKPADPTKAEDAQYTYTFAGWTPEITAVEGNATYKATYTATLRQYNVTFVDENGTTVLQEATAYDYGTAAADIVKPADPTKAADAQYTYTFAGWTPEITAVEGNATYKATYTATIRQYNVTFVDENGTTVLQEATAYDYGTAAADIIKPADPTKAEDAQYTYTFAGWTPEITAVEGNATYKATYTATLRQYNVTFVDENGTTVLQEATAYDYGTAAADIVKPADPTKAADAQYTYTFAGWTPEITAVEGNATYKATYTATTRQYDVTFVDEDGTTVLKTTMAYDYGTSGADIAKPADPTKASTDEFSYTFAGWMVGNTEYANGTALPDVIGDITFKAYYTQKTNQYNVTFVDENGTTVLKEATAYDYGTAATDIVKPADPTKAEDDQYTYTFAGWTPEIAAVTGNATYKATYTATLRQYNVTFVDEDGTTVLKEAAAYDYGTAATVIVRPDDPSKEADDQYTYTFAGWTPAIIAVAGNATYKATYTATLRQYNVTFVDEDGTTVLKAATAYDYGTTSEQIARPDDPTKEATDEFTYTFAGWKVGTTEYANGTALPDVTGNVTFTAYYSATTNQYNITFVDEDGTTVLKEAAAYDYGTAAADIVKPADPTKEEDVQYTYTFAGWTPAITAVTGNYTYKASYTATLKQYNVTFVDSDGTTVLLETKTYDYGTPAANITRPEDPSKGADNNFYYTFTGWDPAVTAVSGNVTYKATYSAFAVTHVTGVSINEKSDGLELCIGDEESVSGILSATVEPENATNPDVTWSVDDPTVLNLQTQEDGSVIVTALKAGTATVTVTTQDQEKSDSMTINVSSVVSGIQLDKTSVDLKLGKTETLTATVLPASARNKIVDWSSSDETTATVATGVTTSQVTITPHKVGTVTITAVTREGEFPAECEVTITGYTVNFKNADAAATVLWSDPAAAYGSTPVYGGNTPVLTATQEYTYTFAGWKAGEDEYPAGTALPAVESDITFTAYYTATKNPYNVTFVDENGTTVLKETAAYDYGTAGTDIVKPDDPTKEATAQYTYTFAGWNDGTTTYGIGTPLPSVTDNVTYKAVYTSSVNTYTVTWVNSDDNQTVLETDLAVPYGTTASYDGAVPTKAETDQYTYEFLAWSSDEVEFYEEMPEIHGDITFYAIYNEWTRSYTVTFTDEDGETISEKSYLYGTTADSITVPEAPAKATTTAYEYTFSNWTPALGTVEGDITYAPQYTARKRVTGVTLDKSTLTMLYSGDQVVTDTLTATVTPSDASSTAVTWTSSNEEAVTISAGTTAGTVILTALAEGEATITATSAVDNKSASCVVTVKIPVTGVTLSPEKLLLQVGGEDGSVEAVLSPSDATNQNVTWEIGDESIATITTDGLEAFVSPVGNGTTNLTVTTEDGGKTASIPVTVTTPVSGLTLPETATFILGTTTGNTLTATIAPATATNKNVTWVSSNDNVATVTAGTDDSTVATITPVSAGTVTITATSNEDETIYDTCTVTIKGYTVTWMNEGSDTPLLTDTNVPYGTPPSFTGEAMPSKAKTDKYTYSFAGWKVGETEYPSGGEALPQVQGDMTLTAYYTASVNEYTISFYDTLEAAAPLHTQQVAYDTVPVYDGTTPAKEETDEYSYEFDGWTNATSSEVITLPAVTGNASYYAHFTATKKKYTITFMDENGTKVLQSGDVEYGEQPVYSGDELTKEQDNGYTYAFDGWDGGAVAAAVFKPEELPVVTQAKTYKAHYKATARVYEVELDLNVPENSSMQAGWNDTDFAGEYTYGVGIELPGEGEALREGCTFAGWYTKPEPTEADTAVTVVGTTDYGDKTFYAKWVIDKGELYYSLEPDGTYSDDGNPNAVLHLYAHPGGDTDGREAIENMNSETMLSNTDYGMSNVTVIVIDEHIWPTSLDHAFSDYDNLLAIEGLEKLHTDDTTSMSSVFSGCSKLTSVDLEYFNTENVTDMSNMFAGCEALAELDVSGFDTGNVTNMSGMFAGCEALTELDVSNFDTSSVEDMSYMFWGCRGLEELDLSSFDTSSVTAMDGMFAYSNKLKTITVSDDFVVDQVQTSEQNNVPGDSMFEGCTSLVGGRGTRVYYGEIEGEENPLDITYARIDWKNDQPGYFCEAGVEDTTSIYYTISPYEEDTSVSQLTFYATEGEGRLKLIRGALNNMSYAQSSAAGGQIVAVDFAEPIYPTSMASAFSGMNIYQFDHLENLHTDDVITMERAFSDCAIPTLDLSSFNTKNVRSMEEMFFN